MEVEELQESQPEEGNQPAQGYRLCVGCIDSPCVFGKKECCRGEGARGNHPLNFLVANQPVGDLEANYSLQIFLGPASLKKTQ